MRVMTETPVIHELARARCLELLEAGSIGRVAVTRHGVPHIVPVNYVVADEWIVFRSGAGTKEEVAEMERPMSFEIDRFDESDRTGWSVLVSGPSEVVTDPAELERIAGHHLDVWAPGARPHTVRLRLDLVSGREISRH
ncbi:MAG: pyridoxamine 5-phosphate oxidase-related FMN-binding protein [Actinomycetia bacterium]|nr:pyridoxamine 5-phosphate oxidase-related FMN-binding protein [Actinomycetes bacterium]